MTAPTKKIFVVGANAARVYNLDQDTGLIESSNATVYNGVSLGGFITLNYEPTSPESIAHPGNNGVLQRDSLPSLDASSGTLEVSRTDFDTIALLTNTKVRAFGDILSVGSGTNQQGTESTVMLVAYAQGKLPSGVRGWLTHVFGKCTLIPKMKSLVREQNNHQYFLQPQYSTGHVTGLAYTINDDGFTSAEVSTYQSNYRLNFAAWKTTSTETEYSFDTNHPFVNLGSGSIVVTKNGTLMTYGATADATHYTADASKITFGAALTNGDIVRCMYEMADTAVDVD